MKNRKKILWAFLGLVLIVFCAPYLVNLRFFSDKVEVKIRQAGALESSIGRLSWNWFPQPHVSVLSSRMGHAAGELRIGEMEVYPDMEALFKGDLQIGSLRIINPDIKVRSLDALGDLISKKPQKDETRKKSFSFPNIILTVEKGRVTLPLDSSLSSPEKTIPALTVSDIGLTFSSTRQGLHVSGSFQSPYMDECVLDLFLEPVPGSELLWDLSVRLKDVKIDPIRGILLSLFKTNKTIDLVCGDIVRAGHITAGEFRFKGNTSQWSDLNRMIVDADLKTATIHIPKTKLLFDQASGNIRIENSLLTGRHLSLSLGKSSGQNGAFLLNLGKNDSRFGLDVDLDADLSELPGVLDEFIPRSELKQELAMVEGLKGKAVVHLKLGEDLHDIKAHLSVRSLLASFFYTRIQEPVEILGGAFEIGPESLFWKNLGGKLGPHVIRGTSGSIIWEKGFFLTVKRLDASMDSSNVYHHLLLDKNMGPRVQSLMSNLAGPLDIHDFSVKGYINQPDTLSWQGMVSSTGVSLDSPRLPQSLSLIIPGLSVSKEKISARVLTARMGEQTLTLSGTVDDPLGKDPSWDVSVYGTVIPSSEHWLKKQGWIPEPLFPKLPCDVSPLSMGWNKNTLTLSGMIRHKNEQGRQILTHADVDISTDKIQVKQLSIDDGQDRAEFTATIPKKQGTEKLMAGFKGRLKARTLDSMFEQNNHPVVDIEGAFDLAYPLDSQGIIHLDGGADISGLKLNLGAHGDVSLSHGSMTGKTDSVTYDLSDLSFSRPQSTKSTFLDRVTFPGIKGKITFLPAGKSRLTIASGNACGVHGAGQVNLPELGMDIHLNTENNKTLSLKDLFGCLGISTDQISGDLSFDGSFKGTPSMIAHGSFTLRATNGVVHKAIIMSKILSLLDLTELFSANPVKNFMADGFRYDSIDITGTIAGNNIHVTRAQVIGAGINLFGNGYIDLENKSLDLLVLASPFKTVDSLVGYIPVIGKILGGKNKSILSVPVKVEGHLDDPRTRILPKPISAMSSGILDAFVYTFKLPFELSYELVNGNHKPTTSVKKP